MKRKHIDIRIQQCLALAQASGCPRRKLAAVLIDPVRNVLLADGYNGGPRGAPGTLCRGHWCERDGFRIEDVEIRLGGAHVPKAYGGGTEYVQCIRVVSKLTGETIKIFHRQPIEKIDEETLLGPLHVEGEQVTPTSIPSTRQRAEAWVSTMAKAFPPIKSGTMMERGCHHAEMNVICNAASRGVSCQGAWMIVLAEPCMMCAKLIHHAGISKVILIDGGYMGGKAGVEYLRDNGVEVEEIEGPKDPRHPDGTSI